MAENEFSTGSSVLTTVISIFLLLLLSRARIMRGLLLKRYAVLLKRYAPRYSKGTLITSVFHRRNVKNSQVFVMRKNDVRYLFDSIYFLTYIIRRRHDDCQ